MRMPKPRSQANSTWPAIVQVLAGVLLFSCSDATSKYLRQTLPAVEIAWLRYVVFVQDFPMTVTGKVQKFTMREVSVAELGLADAAGIRTA